MSRNILYAQGGKGSEAHHGKTGGSGGMLPGATSPHLQRSSQHQLLKQQQQQQQQQREAFDQIWDEFETQLTHNREYIPLQHTDCGGMAETGSPLRNMEGYVAALSPNYHPGTNQLQNFPGSPIPSSESMPELGSDLLDPLLLPSEGDTGDLSTDLCVVSSTGLYHDCNTHQMSPGSLHYSPTVPSSAPYRGEYGFEVSVEKQSKETKSASWTATVDPAGTLQKLYVRVGVPCPFIFRTSTRAAPAGCVIRATPVYMRPEHVQDAVRRCPNHAAAAARRQGAAAARAGGGGDMGGVPGGPGGAGGGESEAAAQHLLRVEHPGARYTEDAYTRRLSVVVPHEQPQAGAEWVTHLVQFMCFSSCVGGLNRRPVQIIFTLEAPLEPSPGKLGGGNAQGRLGGVQGGKGGVQGGQVLGRQAVEVRICACPGRDRVAEQSERQLTPRKLSPLKRTAVGVVGGRLEGGGMMGEVGTGGKRVKVEGDDGTDVFTLNVKGRENYTLLCRIRDCMELCTLLPQSLLEQYRLSVRTHQAIPGDDTNTPSPSALPPCEGKLHWKSGGLANSSLEVGLGHYGQLKLASLGELHQSGQQQQLVYY